LTKQRDRWLELTEEAAREKRTDSKTTCQRPPPLKRQNTFLLPRFEETHVEKKWVSDQVSDIISHLVEHPTLQTDQHHSFRRCPNDYSIPIRLLEQLLRDIAAHVGDGD